MVVVVVLAWWDRADAGRLAWRLYWQQMCVVVLEVEVVLVMAVLFAPEAISTTLTASGSRLLLC